MDGELKAPDSPYGVARRTHLSEDDMVVHYRQDIDPYIEQNQAWQNDFQNYQGEHFFKVAEIPDVIVLKWLNEEGLNIMRPDHFEYIIKKKLNDPDYKWLKSVPGRI